LAQGETLLILDISSIYILLATDGRHVEATL